MRAFGMHWSPWRFMPLTEGSKVTRLELFFDLVFVYAFFTMARSASADFTPAGLLRGLLVLLLLWWCWCSYVITGNSIRTDAGIMPAVLFAAMTAIFVATLAIPAAFDDEPGGLPAPLIFATCYFFIRGLHLLVFWAAARGDRVFHGQLVRVAAPLLVATLLLILAALLPSELVSPEHQFPLRVALWALAVVIEYGASAAVGVRGFQVPSAPHCAERFALIITVALGEVIISVGTGAREVGRSVSWYLVWAGALAIVLTACLWWAYFDIVALAAEQVLQNVDGPARVALARDGYIYLHLPMIAGLILFSLGGEKLLRHAGADRPLPGMSLYLLYGGVILYLLGHLGFQLRALGTVSWTRAVTIVALAALMPVGHRLPALAAMALLTGINLALAIAELIIGAESRRALHSALKEETLSHEARETAWRRRYR
jgi:low temperature requirement protein LtrA